MNRVRERLLRRVIRLPAVGKLAASATAKGFQSRFVPALVELHDLLEESEMAGRYWIWAGVLLGWAREGRLLNHDRDADIGLLREDFVRLESVTQRLVDAGFEPLYRFRNNDGETTELCFRRGDATFEFFVFEPVGTQLRYYVYGWPPNNLVQAEGRIDHQPLVPFEFLGRTWLRPADAAAELERMYGDWRTPRRDWNYLRDDKAIVNRVPWSSWDISWPWPL